MYFIEAKVFADSNQFFLPYFVGKKLRMTFDIAVAAANLVIADYLSAVFGKAVEHFKIVVCRAWAAMQTQQRCFARGCFANNAIIGLKAFKRHISFNNFHMNSPLNRVCKVIIVQLLNCAVYTANRKLLCTILI